MESKTLGNGAVLLQPGELYRHYKGNIYQILCLGQHTETLEDVVVYKAVNKDQIWVRPLQMWNELVEVHGKITPRFTLLK